MASYIVRCFQFFQKQELPHSHNQNFKSSLTIVIISNRCLNFHKFEIHIFLQHQPIGEKVLKCSLRLIFIHINSATVDRKYVARGFSFVSNSFIKFLLKIYIFNALLNTQFLYYMYFRHHVYIRSAVLSVLLQV